MTDKLPEGDLFDFGGTFFPSNSVVAFFNTEADASSVQAEINHALSAAKCEVFSPKKVHAWASDGLKNAGFIASLGYGIKIVEKHEELSKAGKWSIIGVLVPISITYLGLLYFLLRRNLTEHGSLTKPANFSNSP